MNLKEQILKIKTLEELEDMENELLQEYRDNIYNELLKDKKIKEHLVKILDSSEEELENALMINGNAPIDKPE